ncbi:RNA 2',3'-cyclic phosphodiesterase [Paenibacillus sp. IITD108]|uniref:RNA 2',3'-cyclic phosphodiesterase n=1 Tax=Paenibacillus sp. IITD108 TaxID=3116649 RepID=UPI002F3E64C1
MSTAEQSMRLFVAVPVSAKVTEELGNWAQLHKSKIAFRKWTHPSDYHITLQFLGDTVIEQVEHLKNSLAEIKADSFSLKLDAAGFFGLPKSPRVLWSDVAGEVERLRSLQRAVTQATSRLGFEAEKRAYVPHITIARNYNSQDPFPAEMLQTVPSQLSWTADRFILMRTHMKASPMYENIGSFLLNKG